MRGVGNYVLSKAMPSAGEGSRWFLRNLPDGKERQLLLHRQVVIKLYLGKRTDPSRGRVHHHSKGTSENFKDK